MLPTPTDPLAIKRRKPLKLLGVRLDDAILLELEREAQKRGMAPSTLARAILAEWLAKAAKR